MKIKMMKMFSQSDFKQAEQAYEREMANEIDEYYGDED